jgi:hypothetical protein
MPFNTYIPRDQDSNFLRTVITQLGYVGIDVGDGFEQYCKCNHMKCVELFENAKRYFKAEEPKDGLSKPVENVKMSSLCELKLKPKNRSLVTLFRHRFHKDIGLSGGSGIDIKFIDLSFTGDEKRYQELLKNIPKWKVEE